MTEVTPIPAAEIRRRQKVAVEHAAKRGLDGLLVWGRGGTSLDFYGDVFYLTGHHTPFPPNQDTPQWSARSYSALVLPVEGEPILVIDLPEFVPEDIQVEDVRSTLHVPKAAAEALRDAGLADGNIGLVGRDTLLAAQLRLIEEELGASLRSSPAEEILERMRMIKSETELQILREVATVGVGWMEKMMDAIEPGVTEGDVVGEGLSFLASNGGFAYDTAICSGPRSQHLFNRNAIPTWDSRRRLEPGDLVHIDAWGAVDGYYTDFCRSTVVGGEPTDPQRELLDGSIAIIDHMIAGVKPGIPIGEIYGRGSSWLEENGFGPHRGTTAESGTDFGNLFPAFGHSFGVGLEPPWIIEDEPTLIAENMCLAIEALVARNGVGGAGFEQEVIVTADGCEVITEACPSRFWS